jgi:hypothetical protein
VRESERESETESERDCERERKMCVCVSVIQKGIKCVCVSAIGSVGVRACEWLCTKVREECERVSE